MIWELFFIPLLSLITAVIIAWVNAKRKQALQSTNDELTKMCINAVADVVNSAVITTNETYVKSLKAQNAFDVEAQKQALEQTKIAVTDVLSDEVKTQLTKIYGNLDLYLINKIEESVKINK